MARSIVRAETASPGKPAAAPGRPRLLFLCQTLPFPPDGGVSIRSYNILRLLSRAFDVTALCFYRKSTRASMDAVNAGVAGLSEFAHTEAFAIPQEHNRPRLVWDHLRSVARRRVYTQFAYHSAVFSSRLHELLSDRDFGLVHLDSLDLSGYLPALRDLPVVCTHHNIESALMRRRAATESSALLRPYLQLQANLTEAEERYWCDRVTLNVTVSETDRDRLSRLAPGARVTTVPNGVDTAAFQPTRGDQRGLVFVGGYTWYPNRDAMAFFAREILPLVRLADTELPVTWVGRAPEGVRSRYAAEHRMRLTGYVADIRPDVDAAACYVVPLRVGGGTRLKILDAWAMGKPVVSTSVGCEGLDARDGENILIRDTPQAFAEAVKAVLGDEELRRRLGEGARRTAERTYDWEVIGEAMINDYLALANAR